MMNAFWDRSLYKGRQRDYMIQFAGIRLNLMIQTGHL